MFYSGLLEILCYIGPSVQINPAYLRQILPPAEYRANKRPFYHSSTDHPPVTKGAAPCHHPEILPHSALTIQSFALAGTTCKCTPGIRPIGILALPFGVLPLEPGEGFDGVSQTGQPVAPGLPAADLLEPG